MLATKIEDFVDPNGKPELIEITRALHNGELFNLPKSIWVEFRPIMVFRHMQGYDVTEMQAGILSFPKGFAIKVTFPLLFVKESIEAMMAAQIGMATMTPEDNSDIYISFLRSNFVWVGDFIKEELEKRK